MTEKKKRLGRGLDTLIPEKKERQAQKGLSPEDSTADKADKEKTSSDGVTMIRTSKIEPSIDQPRKKFNEKPLLELADSIKQFGVLQPLIVQSKDDHYEIIAGERRWRAAKLAGVKEVPVIIKKFTVREAVEISLIENIQREDLNPIEEALAYKRLLNEFSLKQEEIAEKVSKSRAAVTNSMRLLKLSARIQQMIKDGKLSPGHARALLAIDDEERQYILANRICEENLSVRETESLIKKLNRPLRKQKEKKPENAFVYDGLEQRMESALGTKVRIKPKAGGRGKIEIEYYSEEELEHIFDFVMSAGNLQ